MTTTPSTVTFTVPGEPFGKQSHKMTMVAGHARSYCPAKTRNYQARIVDASPYMPMSFLPQNESYRHMVQFSFVYEEIEWNWLPDSVVEQDKWRSPGGG